MTTKPKTRHATVAEVAALNFEPWEGPIDYKKLPTNEQFIEHGLGHLATCRLALATMYKTKAELAEIYGEKMDDGESAGVALMNGHFASKDFFEHFTKLLDTAAARIICAGSSYATADRSLRKDGLQNAPDPVSRAKSGASPSLGGRNRRQK